MRARDACERASPAIEDWRRRIDAIDTQLMGLLNSRSACAVEIGRIKRELGLPVYSPEREAFILERVLRENPGPLDATAVTPRVRADHRREPPLERIAARRRRRSQETRNEGTDMVIVMEGTATEEQVQKVIEALVEVGYDVHRSTGVSHTVLGAVGVPRTPVDPNALELLPGRARGGEDLRALQARGPDLQGRATPWWTWRGVKVGGREVIVMAGPCSVETREQVRDGGPRRSRPRGRVRCAAAPSSRAPRPTPSRATARRPCAGCARPPTSTAWPWSARSWTCAPSR